MASIKNGLIDDSRVEVKRYSSIEHGGIGKVTSIVLHRTAGASAASSLSAYASGQTEGAHFLISNDGKIYQTASMDQLCWHVGILYSRCMNEKSCDPAELKTITALMHEKGLSFRDRVKNVSKREVGKSYPLRFPANTDSIGIEVVGRYNGVTKIFEQPTNEQKKALKWLVDLLIEHFGLNLKNDVYAHGVIARKKQAEGLQLLQSLSAGVSP